MKKSGQLHYVKGHWIPKDRTHMTAAERAAYYRLPQQKKLPETEIEKLLDHVEKNPTTEEKQWTVKIKNDTVKLYQLGTKLFTKETTTEKIPIPIEPTDRPTLGKDIGFQSLDPEKAIELYKKYQKEYDRQFKPVFTGTDYDQGFTSYNLFEKELKTDVDALKSIFNKKQFIYRQPSIIEHDKGFTDFVREQSIYVPTGPKTAPTALYTPHTDQHTQTRPWYNLTKEADTLWNISKQQRGPYAKTLANTALVIGITQGLIDIPISVAGLYPFGKKVFNNIRDQPGYIQQIPRKVRDTIHSTGHHMSSRLQTNPAYSAGYALTFLIPFRFLRTSKALKTAQSVSNQLKVQKFLGHLSKRAANINIRLTNPRLIRLAQRTIDINRNILRS